MGDAKKMRRWLLRGILRSEEFNLRSGSQDLRTATSASSMLTPNYRTSHSMRKKPPAEEANKAWRKVKGDRDAVKKSYCMKLGLSITRQQKRRCRSETFCFTVCSSLLQEE